MRRALGIVTTAIAIVYVLDRIGAQVCRIDELEEHIAGLERFIDDRLRAHTARIDRVEAALTGFVVDTWPQYATPEALERWLDQGMTFTEVLAHE